MLTIQLHIATTTCLGILLIGPMAFSKAQTGANVTGTRVSIDGFDVSNAAIPTSEIRSGGPERDGIPSIDAPQFVSPNKANFLQAADQVLSITISGETRAYPLRILVWHEIVNDVIGNRPIVATYCPLCGTAMIFNRQIGDRALTFGVSGLLYQSDVLMYDRETESLWSQLALKAVSGPLVNTQFEWLPSEQMTWGEWQQKYPNGKVLSTRTGHARDYSQTPYEAYESSPDTMFPVPAYRHELPRKALVLGIILNGEAKAYPMDKLPPKEAISDSVGGTQLHVARDPVSGTVKATANSGETIPAVRVYWFAWQAFYPQTGLWKN